MYLDNHEKEPLQLKFLSSYLFAVDFATGDKGRLMSSFNERVEVCSATCCDVGLHVDVTSWDDDVKQSMSNLATAHGVNSFRIYMCGRWQLNDEEVS